MTARLQASVLAAEPPLALMDRFIQERDHDPELDHWCPWLLAEYKAWLLEQAEGGAR